MAKTEEPADYTEYPGKEETAFQKRFADWMLTDAVGVDPATDFKTKEAAFRAGVKLGTSLRIIYQQSDDNQAVRQEAAEARAAALAEREKAKAEPKPVKAKKATKAAPVEADEDDETEEEAPPAKPAKATKAAKKAAKKPAKKAPAPADDDEDDDAEF